MTKSKFVECSNCKTIHYVVSNEMLKSLRNKSSDAFLDRNLVHCFNCGSKKNFSIISGYYAGNFSPSDKIPPIFLDYEKLKQATNKP